MPPDQSPEPVEPQHAISRSPARTGGTTSPRYLAQYDHADLGLVDDDNTEMLTAPVNPVVGATGESRPNHPISRQEVR